MRATFLRSLPLSGPARWGTRPEAPELACVLDFGDVAAERSAGIEGCGLIDASDRGLVRVRGSEATAFLHRLLANEVRPLEPGAGNENLLLSPKGRVLHAFHLQRTEEGFDLSTTPGDAPRLVQALDRYLFSEDVELLNESEEHGALELLGASAPAVLATLGDDVAGCGVVHTEVAGSDGLRLEARAERLPELWKALVAAGATPLGVAARELLRVEAGAALFGVDIDDSVYPQEVRLEQHFHLQKGCYVGQEVVLKLDTYGGLKRRLVGLAVDHPRPLSKGTRLFGDGERPVGVITSWILSPTLESGLALGLLRVGKQRPGTALRLLGAADASSLGSAEVVRLPLRPGARQPTGLQE